MPLSFAKSEDKKETTRKEDKRILNGINQIKLLNRWIEDRIYQNINPVSGISKTIDTSNPSI